MQTMHLSLLNKEYEMIRIMDKVLALFMVAFAVATAWAVLTPNHLYIG